MHHLIISYSNVNNEVGNAVSFVRRQTKYREGWIPLLVTFLLLCPIYVHVQGGGGARLTGHIQIEGDEEQLRATMKDIEQR